MNDRPNGDARWLLCLKDLILLGHPPVLRSAMTSFENDQPDAAQTSAKDQCVSLMLRNDLVFTLRIESGLVIAALL